MKNSDKDFDTANEVKVIDLTYSKSFKISPGTKLIKFISDPLKGKTREEFFNYLTANFKEHALSAYIFGSVARGEQGTWSDIDIIIVKETDTPFVERGLEFIDLIPDYDEVDILVYTPDEFNKLTTNPTFGFWSNVTKEMVKLF